MKLGVFISLLLTALIAREVIAADVERLQSPAGKQTSLSRLTTDANGRIHLSWVSSTGPLSSLYHASFADDEWSNAMLVGDGEDWFVNWADFPFFAANDAGMAANWLRKSSDGIYDYDVVATFYSAATAQWSDPAVIHHDDVSAEYGFVSMLPMHNDATLIAWLDGRETRRNESHAGAHIAVGMTLRAGIFNNEGKKTTEWQLDDLVCDCCQTSSAMTGSGPVVVYRNRTNEEVRDTYITRLVDGQWSEPAAVYNDNWQVAGCPVNGPSVVSGNGLTVVAWFTAKNDDPTVSFALSQDDGKTFGAPVIVAQESTNGRISLAVLDAGGFAISWLETSGALATIMLARYDKHGRMMKRLAVAETKSSRRSGFPVISSHGNDVYVTWTDIEREPRVKVARMRF